MTRATGESLVAASDLDGTILQYFAKGDEAPRANWSLIGAMIKLGIKRVSFATNQGGVGLGYIGKARADGRPYPTPQNLSKRLWCAKGFLEQAGIEVSAVRVSLYHPYAAEVMTARQKKSCAELVREQIRGISPDSRVFWTPDMRKPAPGMLLSLGANLFYGDSEDDSGAAKAAGIHFVPVARFM